MDKQEEEESFDEYFHYFVIMSKFTFGMDKTKNYGFDYHCSCQNQICIFSLQKYYQKNSFKENYLKFDREVNENLEKGLYYIYIFFLVFFFLFLGRRTCTMLAVVIVKIAIFVIGSNRSFL